MCYQLAKKSDSNFIYIPCICGLVFPSIGYAMHYKILYCPNTAYSYWEWNGAVSELDLKALPTYELRLYTSSFLIGQTVQPATLKKIMTEAPSGPLVFAFDSCTNRLRANATNLWREKIGTSYRQISGAEHPIVHLLLDYTNSHAFPLLPGTEEFDTWLRLDPAAGPFRGRRRLHNYLEQTSFPFAMEMLSRRKPSERFLMAFEQSLTYSPQLLRAACALMAFTFDCATC